MVKIINAHDFEEEYNKLDKSILDRIDKLIFKIIENPEIGKPMRYGRKGTREVYVGSFRLSYNYNKEEDIIYFLDLYHKDEQ